jgi:RNA polymerase sigma factor (sigma-70 family)
MSGIDSARRSVRANFPFGFAAARDMESKDMPDDAELLCRYAEENADAAFAEFVARHINSVYSAALRQSDGDSHGARDITQLTFLTAARKARRMARHPLLAGWLYNTAQHIAWRAMRAERTRRRQEAAAAKMNEVETPPEVVTWERIRPVLEAAMRELGERDREAVVLRFLGGYPFARIGAALGLSEDAARMRVDRALDKLRRQFARRGIASTNSILAAALSAHAVEVAPAGMASSLATACVAAAGASGGGLAITSIEIMSTSKTLAAGVLIVCAAITGGVYALRVAHQEAADAATAAQRERVAAADRATTVAEAASLATPAIAGDRNIETVPAPAAPAPTPLANIATGPMPAESGNPPMVLSEVLGPNNLFQDRLFGVSMTYPEGWTVRQAMRWGTDNRENTVFLTPEPATTARPSMYYRRYPDGTPPLQNAEAYLREIAESKEKSRIAGGRRDYKNVPESFAYGEINGNPALSYFATFTQGDEVRTEYFIRILGQQGYVMFFTTGRFEDVRTIMPQFRPMAGTVQSP